MKKLLFLLCLLTAVVVPSDANIDDWKRLAELQNRLRKDMIFSNGKSFDDLEAELRAQFPNMPECVIFPGYGNGGGVVSNHVFVNPGYAVRPNFFKNYAYKNSSVNNGLSSFVEKMQYGDFLQIPSGITKLSYDEARFALMHEIGHAQYPYLLLAIEKSPVMFCLPIAYACKKIIELGGYKNKMTRAALMLIASTLCVGNYWSGFSTKPLLNLEERRADNFAIKHADPAALRGGIAACKKMDRALRAGYPESKFSKYVPYEIGLKILAPDHPSCSSRIAKIERALDRKLNQ